MNKKPSTQLKGIIPPLVTPLTSEDDLDRDAYINLIDFVIDGGVSGIFAMGSSGEALRVPRKTHMDALRTAIEAAAGRVPVFLGVIAAGTHDVIENIRNVEEMGGEYVVVTAPFYLQNSGQSEIIRHFERICASTKLNVVAYNIPGMVHVNILPQTIREIASFDNLVAYKDSAADWEQFQRNLFLLADRDIAVFNGAEELCCAAMLLGADGCVPGLANFYPQLFVDLCAAACSGDRDKTFALQKKVWTVRQSLFIGDHWMGAMKAIAHYYGFGSNRPAYPILPFTDEQTEALNRLLKNFDKEADS